MERKLPVLQIEGTAFVIDVLKEELREKANPKNVMDINKMYYVGGGYSFDYDPSIRNFPDYDNMGDFNDNANYIKKTMPDLVLLDPLGMAKKYNLTEAEIKGKTDFDCMVTQGALHLRWNKGILPTLKIAGHTFYVDMKMGKLRPKDDFKSKGIIFSEIRDYYDRSRRSYLIPYNPTTHEFQEVNHRTIVELPKDIVIVQFPHEYELDRVGWNKKHGFDLRRGLEDQEPQLHFKSVTLPWGETNIPDSIKYNLEQQSKQKERQDFNVQQDKIKPQKEIQKQVDRQQKKGRRM